MIKAGHFSVCLSGQRSDIGGLFSCFGNAFRCEISITCRGGNKKKSNGKVCNLSSDDDQRDSRDDADADSGDTLSITHRPHLLLLRDIGLLLNQKP
ncbi:hypothetical protein QYF36_024072 [Acer negundo]|nr:hypothetical protein QYF36_024072 [Acer negundo]